MSGKDTIEKAFGNIPKEMQSRDMWDWLPTKRSFRYFYLTLWRKIFR